MAEPIIETGTALVVAIDGPSGVGKSTVARLLAERLRVPMLDTGAMYRAVALKVLALGIDLDDRAAILDAAANADLGLRWSGESGVEVTLDGEAVEARIRTPEVSAATSKVSVHPEIRRRLVELQRVSAARYGAVVEGRDIGSVVFPRTPYKFFLSAQPQVRAERRFRQLVTAGKAANLPSVERDIAERDDRDRRRATSPLVCDETYHLIDTSELGVDEIVEEMVREIERRRPDPDSQPQHDKTASR